MDKNVSKWILLVVCLGVWGGVFYTLFAPEKPRGHTPGPVITPLETTAEQGFKLLSSYTDPFLQAGVARKAKTAPSPLSSLSVNPSVSRSILQERRSPDKPKKKKRVVFPQIIYRGFVRSQSGAGSASVVVDGKPALWEDGQELQGMYLLDIQVDSIIVSKDGTPMTVER